MPSTFVARSARRPVASAAALASFALAMVAAVPGAPLAQTAAKHNNNTYGSPLDTIRSSRLWTDTPEPQGFVRDSRPDGATLDYTPLTGRDPERPKPRDAANVAALQAELENAGARLAGTAQPRRRSAPGKLAAGAPRHRPAAASAD